MIKKILKQHSFILIVFLCCAVYFSYNFIYQELKKENLESKIYYHKEEIQKLNREIDRLEKDLKEVKSNKNIERLAREKLKMVFPNEVIYIIEQDN